MQGYIIKACATSMSTPDYFYSKEHRFADELKTSGWIRIECREITKHDGQIEGILKRCSLGSKAERANLRALFNIQDN